VYGEQLVLGGLSCHVAFTTSATHYRTHATGLDVNLVQDNDSKSSQGVLRRITKSSILKAN
jgi:hypothetical protein